MCLPNNDCRLYSNSTSSTISTCWRLTLEPILISVMANEHATHAFIQTINNLKLITNRLFRRDRLSDFGSHLLKRLDYTLEHLGVVLFHGFVGISFDPVSTETICQSMYSELGNVDVDMAILLTSLGSMPMF